MLYIKLVVASFKNTELLLQNLYVSLNCAFISLAFFYNNFHTQLCLIFKLLLNNCFYHQFFYFNFILY